MITEKQARALSVIGDTPGLTAKGFAVRYFTDPSQDYLFTAVSNQGNGACAGKKAWLCAGSLLGKLKKLGLVAEKPYSDPPRFLLTSKGASALDEFHKSSK